MGTPVQVLYHHTPFPGSPEEHVRTMQLLALLAIHDQVQVVNHDAREAFLVTETHGGETVTTIESCTDGVLAVFTHGAADQGRTEALESAARVAVNLMSRTTTLLLNLLEPR